MTHSGQKPYNCPHCDKGMYKVNNCIQDLNRKIIIIIESYTVLKPYQYLNRVEIAIKGGIET